MGQYLIIGSNSTILLRNGQLAYNLMAIGCFSSQAVVSIFTWLSNSFYFFYFIYFSREFSKDREYGREVSSGGGDGASMKSKSVRLYCANFPLFLSFVYCSSRVFLRFLSTLLQGETKLAIGHQFGQRLPKSLGYISLFSLSVIIVRSVFILFLCHYIISFFRNASFGHGDIKWREHIVVWPPFFTVA